MDLAAAYRLVDIYGTADLIHNHCTVHIPGTEHLFDQPILGITVIDLSHVYNGPYCTLLMALSGAAVIKAVQSSNRFMHGCLTRSVSGTRATGH